VYVRNLQHKRVKLRRIWPRFQSVLTWKTAAYGEKQSSLDAAHKSPYAIVTQLSNDFHNRIIQWLNVAIQLTIKIHKTTIYPAVLVMNTNKDTIYPLFGRRAKRSVSLHGTNTAVECFRTQCLAKYLNQWEAATKVWRKVLKDVLPNLYFNVTLSG
jgi:hypothetical protein